MTRDELGQRMTHREFTRWRAHDALAAEDKAKAAKKGLRCVIPLTTMDIA